jgi:HEPN domain-containing protein
MVDPVVALSREWFVKASEDIAATKLLIQGNITGSALFHCQQAAEKAIKGYLLFHGRQFPRTHDIVQLLKIAIHVSPVWSGWDEIGDALSEYAVEVRYPGGGTMRDVVPGPLFSDTVRLVRLATAGVALEVVQGLEFE